jgi:rhodanese-related sulfurtransferase
MHVHELNPKKTIVAMAIFVVVIVAGLLTITNPRLKYSIEPPEAIVAATSFSSGIDAAKIQNMLSSSTTTAILIDIRNHYKFARGHIASAQNISAVELLDKEHIKWLTELKDDKAVVVIYGEDHLQANAPWMVLQQLGFDNITFLNGGYNNYLEYEAAKAGNKNFSAFVPDKAVYNYAEVAKENPSGTVNESPKKKHTVVRRKKKGTATAGGC